MATPEHASPASSAPSSATPSAGQKRPAPPPEPQLTRTGRQQRRKTTDEYVGYGRLLTRCIEMWTLPSIILHEGLTRYASEDLVPATTYKDE